MAAGHLVDVGRLGRDDPEVARPGVGRRAADLDAVDDVRAAGAGDPQPVAAMASRCSCHRSMAQTSWPAFPSSAAYTAPIAPVPTIAIFITSPSAVRTQNDGISTAEPGNQSV